MLRGLFLRQKVSFLALHPLNKFVYELVHALMETSNRDDVLLCTLSKSPTRLRISDVSFLLVNHR